MNTPIGQNFQVLTQLCLEDPAAANKLLAEVTTKLLEGLPIERLRFLRFGERVGSLCLQYTLVPPEDGVARKATMYPLIFVKPSLLYGALVSENSGHRTFYKEELDTANERLQDWLNEYIYRKAA